ncbi:uncharacterized protein LOC124818148 isoform X2 [Hydra vulgaris]|uniref:Uncharacterized protein LOC124818148 isoform X2 n=1 Tax=Hydra vulgaris TaxID=6087 RepID=A0ABM4BS01_HYDVU
MIELMIKETEVELVHNLNHGFFDEVDEEDYSIEAKIRAKMRSSQSRQFTRSIFKAAISPMQLEMNRYFNLTDPPPADVDVLQWWRRHHSELSSYCQVCQKIPLYSAMSECSHQEAQL